MKKVLIALICLASVVNTVFSGEEFSSPEFEVQQTKNEALADIDEVVNRALEVFQVPGASVGVVVDGELIFAKGYGYRDLERKLPVTPETLFAIGSCSKAFTTFVLGALVDEGVIEWDDSVIKHLPEFRLMDEHATRNMTIRDLVTHRSGLPRHDFVWYNSDLSRVEFLNRLKHLEFVNDLREKFHYNNLMYAVAGLLIEKVTGQSWENAVQQRIFIPLGMGHSNFSVENSKNNDNFSYPYAERKEVVQAIPFRNISNIGPAGSINSNVVDMSKWLQLQLSNGTVSEKKFVQETTLNEMHTLQFAKADFPKDRGYFLGYGLGWFIGNYGGHYLVEHGGGIDGFIANTSLFPQKKIGVIVLSNSSDGGGGFVNSVSKSIFDRLLELEKVDWVEKLSTIQKEGKSSKKDVDSAGKHLGTKPSHKLEDYVGEYEHPGYGLVKVYLKDGQLVSSYNRIVTPLTHKHYDIFLGSKECEDPVFADMHFSFQTCCSGYIAEVHIPFEAKPTVFKKKVAGELQDLKYLKQFEGSYGDEHLTATVQLRGNRLVVFLPGQPDYELVPEKKQTFAFKGLPGFTARFVFDAEDQVVELQSIQPNGVFSLKVKK